jgi:uncharacterized membrane protein
MTEDYKMDIVGLQLSFIPWNILGILTLFIGRYFVRPYKQAAYAQMYLRRKQEVIDAGLIDANDFCLPPRESMVK